MVFEACSRYAKMAACETKTIAPTMTLPESDSTNPRISQMSPKTASSPPKPKEMNLPMFIQPVGPAESKVSGMNL